MTQEKPKMEGWHEYKPCHYISLKPVRMFSREEVQHLIDAVLGHKAPSSISSKDRASDSGENRK